MKLLLIEDNLAMQTTLQRTIQRRGMQVVSCGDGARALDRWRASVPDVVVLDLSLPGMDGLQVLAAARAEGLATPVLILTARGTIGDRILGLNTGADAKSWPTGCARNSPRPARSSSPCAGWAIC
jgi:two-component system response regulator TctD